MPLERKTEIHALKEVREIDSSLLEGGEVVTPSGVRARAARERCRPAVGMQKLIGKVCVHRRTGPTHGHGPCACVAQGCGPLAIVNHICMDQG